MQENVEHNFKTNTGRKTSYYLQLLIGMACGKFQVIVIGKLAEFELVNLESGGL